MCDEGFYQFLLIMASIGLVIVSVLLHEATTELKRLQSNSKMQATVAEILDQKHQKPPHPRSHSPGSSF